MINHELKCIFIHIPRCGGSSIEVGLDGKDWWHSPLRQEKHITAKRAKVLYGEWWNDYFKFSMVRNPWDLEVSWYEHKKQHYDNISFTQYITDPEFVKVTKQSYKTRDRKWRKIIPDVGDCVSYLTVGADIVMDYVGRFENYETDYAAICSILGVVKPLPHVGRSQRSHYKTYYQDETRNIVESRYTQDITSFNYSF